MRGVRVLYVSKAMVVDAYRDKLEALGRLVDVTAVVPARWGPDVPARARADGYALETLPVTFSGRNHLHLYHHAGKLIDRVQPHLVHIDEEPYSAVTAQMTAQCRRRRVPAIFFAWQNLTKRLPPPFGAMRSYVFARVAGALAGSPAAADVLRDAGFGGPLSVVPQVGVNPERFAVDARARRCVRRRLAVRDEEVLVGYAGRLIAAKGIHVLVQAVAAVPNARLLIVGDGPERRRLEAATPDARFAGRVPSTHMPEWLAALDVLVLPSLSRRTWCEQFGRILVEAMSCGVPVVGSDSGEIPNVIGDAGMVVPEGDVGALTRALERLTSTPALRRELADRGRRRVLERFTHERIVADTVRFYDSVLGDRVGP